MRINSIAFVFIAAPTQLRFRCDLVQAMSRVIACLSTDDVLKLPPASVFELAISKVYGKSTDEALAALQAEALKKCLSCFLKSRRRTKAAKDPTLAGLKKQISSPCWPYCLISVRWLVKLCGLQSCLFV